MNGDRIVKWSCVNTTMLAVKHYLRYYLRMERLFIMFRQKTNLLWSSAAAFVFLNNFALLNAHFFRFFAVRALHLLHGVLVSLQCLGELGFCSDTIGKHILDHIQ